MRSKMINMTCIWIKKEKENEYENNTDDGKIFGEEEKKMLREERLMNDEQKVKGRKQKIYCLRWLVTQEKKKKKKSKQNKKNRRKKKSKGKIINESNK